MGIVKTGQTTGGLIAISPNAKVITNFTTNWYCNGCDQWHEAYRNTRDIIKFTMLELQRYITNHKNSFKNAFNSLLKPTYYIHCYIKL